MLVYLYHQEEKVYALEFKAPKFNYNKISSSSGSSSIYYSINDNEIKPLIYLRDIENVNNTSSIKSNNYLSLQKSGEDNDSYANYLKVTTDKSVNLTSSYQDEIAIWNAHDYSNATMSKITEAYLPKFISQLNQFNSTIAPIEYSKVKENYVKSFECEIKSYQFFDIYLKSNSAIANKLSTDFLSLALSFETTARNAFAQITNSSSSNGNTNSDNNPANHFLFYQRPVVSYYNNQGK
ncbi:MAG: hypothetical protein ACTHKC_07140 [Candidatus Nitrosocosmicus sp.]